MCVYVLWKWFSWYFSVFLAFSSCRSVYLDSSLYIQVSLILSFSWYDSLSLTVSRYPSAPLGISRFLRATHRFLSISRYLSVSLQVSVSLFLSVSLLESLSLFHTLSVFLGTSWRLLVLSEILESDPPETKVTHPRLKFLSENSFPNPFQCFSSRLRSQNLARARLR